MLQTDISAVVEQANDTHLSAWADICRRHDIPHTPLEPAAAAELLLNRQLCLDGARLAALLRPRHPAPTAHSLTQVTPHTVQSTQH